METKGVTLSVIVGMGLGAAVTACCMHYAASRSHAASRDQRRPRSRYRTKQSSTAVIGCASKGEYTRSIAHLVSEGDSVLIIRGTTDGSVSRAAEDPDGGQAAAEVATGSAAAVCIFTGDLTDLPAIQTLSATAAAGRFTVVCLDVSNIYGNDLYCDAVALVKLLSSTLSPKSIVIKSRSMAMHGRCFHPSRRFLEASQRTTGAPGRPVTLCSIGVTDYRAAIPAAVREGDRVLEIGTAFGNTAFDVSKVTGATGKVVGIDIGKACIQRARTEAAKKSNSNPVQFEVADAWDTCKLLELDRAFDVIFIDVGGLSGSDGIYEALALCRMLSCTYKRSLRYIVIKSRCLHDHASIFTHAADVLEQQPIQGK